MHLVATRNGEVPNFSLLLGSGASITSGVKTAQDMIREWRSLLLERHGFSEEDASSEKQLSNFSWYNHEDEYSLLFEEIFDQPSQRRVFIEECVKDAHPGWGYVYLTSLLSNRFFDVVFTTNFDDLINESCYLYSDGLRPIVAAHDSAIQGIRVTSSRPKIIKLHGDFLYDNIKNTIAELETLEANTKRKLSQFAKEYGLVVIGYSGHDRSIMDTLELLLRDDENYRHGVYWCTRQGEQRSARLNSLLRRDRVYLVEIDGFDEFMADLHQISRLALPKSVAQPLEMAEARVRLITSIDYPLRSHAVIDAHIQEAMENINAARGRKTKIPPIVEATILDDMGEFDEALPLWRQIHLKNLEDESYNYRYATALANAKKYEELVELIDNLLSTASLDPANCTYFLLRANANEKVIEVAAEYLNSIAFDFDNEESSEVLVRINRAIALKRLGYIDEMMAELDLLENGEYLLDSNLQAGIAALRKEKGKMFLILNETINKTLTLRQLIEFPVFEDYLDDPEFNLFIDANRRRRQSRSPRSHLNASENED